MYQELLPEGVRCA